MERASFLMQSVTAAVVVGVAGVVAPSSAWAAQAFQESNGQVVIEAEHFDANISRNSKTWTQETQTAGFSGEAYLTALPNTGTTNSSGYTTNSPELQYHVNFTTTGTYYVWVRGYGPTTADDSIHAGVDGTAPSSADKISSSVFLSGFNWSQDTMDGSPARLTISSPGVHVVQLWMREDGFKVDKLLFTTSTSSTPPLGVGPTESQRITLSDTTPPTAPGGPIENSSSSDRDYDDNGNYWVYWTLASDPESAVTAYEIQERSGTTGIWQTLPVTPTTGSVSVSGRLHNTRYFYRVLAKNGAGLWSSWSPESDGILVDTTNPTTFSVTDDGATTSSTTTIHASWTASSDPESGLARYEYRIHQDTSSGTVIVGWTSTGLTTAATKTSLSLVTGKTYYFEVRAINNAGRTTTAYSDGILVNTDVTGPIGSVSINNGDPATNNPAVTLSLSATDASGVVRMAFSNDGIDYSPEEAYATTKSWPLADGDGTKTVYVKFADSWDNWSAPATDTIELDTTPPSLEFIAPRDGAVIPAPSP